MYYFQKDEIKTTTKFAISISFSLVETKMMITFAIPFNPYFFGENEPLNT